MVRFYAVCVAALLFFPSGAGAQATYTPSPLNATQLFRHTVAARGRLIPGSYTEVLDIKRGAETSVRTIVYNGDDYRATSVTGPFTTADGTYKGTKWNQDASGVVTTPSGFHFAEDPNVRALNNPDGGDVSVVGITVSEPHRYVVDVHPADGNHEVRYYDTGTYYLVRDEIDEKDQRKHVETYDDFRTVFGSTRAYHATISDGRPENDYDRTTTSFEHTPAADLTVPASRSLFSFANGTPVVVPMVSTEHGIVIAASIGGRTFNFALDSGAGTSSLDPAVATSLGLKQYAKHSATVGGSYMYSQAMIPAMSLGGVPLTKVGVATIALPKLLASNGVVGLLGHDVLASAVTRVDFANRTVTFYPRDTAPAFAAADAVPIELDDYVPRVVGNLGGVRGHFMIDTGAGMTLFFNSFAKRDASIVYGKRDSDLIFVGGRVAAKVAFAEGFSIGKTTFPPIRALVPESTLAERDQYDGIIGRDVLRDYVLYFDYANQRMFIRPQGG